MIFEYLKINNGLNSEELQNIPTEIRALLLEMKTNKFHSDGSYDLWTSNKNDFWYQFRTGNDVTTWLTAYVIRVITQAMISGTIGYDYSMLKLSLDFLSIKKQWDGNGYFFTNDGYSKYPYSSGTINSKMYTTSFVLLSFLYYERLYGRSYYGSIVDHGMNYLNAHYDQADAYPAALACYVFALRDAKNVRGKLSDLESRYGRTSSDGRYYSNNVSSTSDSITVLTSSYVALAYIKLGLYNQAHPIVEWLHGVRKISGSHNEGHDSAMALDAITEYAKHVKKIDPQFTVKATSPPYGTKVFNINQSNLGGYVEFEQNKEVSIAASGVGTLNVDVICDQYENATFDNDMFKMSTTVTRISSIQTSLKTCLTYTPGNEGFTAEMIILDVQLQSGFVYEESLNPFLFRSFIKVNSLKFLVIFPRGAPLVFFLILILELIF